MFKQAAKKAVLRAARSSGYFRRLASSDWRRERVLILAWHGVSLLDEHIWKPALFISPELLDARLTAIRENGCTILSLAEAVRRLAGGTLPERAVALTFDDGFYNFHTHAVPILRKHNAPATVYVTSYYVDDNRPVPYLAASYLLWRHRTAGRARIHAIPGFDSVDLSSVAVHTAVHQAFVQHCESAQMGADEKHEMLGRLAGDLGVDIDRFSAEDRIVNLMTPEQVAALPRDIVSVDLHTHRHRVPLNEELFTREIVENRTRLTALTGVVSTDFCFPSGAWSPLMLPWLKKLGVDTATTCVHGLAAPEHDRLLLPRFLDGTQVSELDFEAWLCGFAERIPSPHKQEATTLAT